MNEFIRFETFQYISFVLACSLWFYMVTVFIRWLIREMLPKKKNISLAARQGLFSK